LLLITGVVNFDYIISDFETISKRLTVEKRLKKRGLQMALL